MLRSGFEYEVFVAGLGLVAGLVGVEDELGERSLTVFVAETTVADMNCGELGDDDAATLAPLPETSLAMPVKEKGERPQSPPPIRSFKWLGQRDRKSVV